MEYIKKDYDPEQALLDRQKTNAQRLGALASVDLGLL